MTSSSSGSLWHDLLRDVAQHTGGGRRFKDKKTLFILGDEGCGKSMLISRLQGRKYVPEDNPQGVGLGYSFVDVKDVDAEDIVARMGVYTLDGHSDHEPLLRHALNKETLDSTLLMIVVDLSRPWLIKESLNRWAAALEEHIKALDCEEQLEEMRKKLVADYQHFVATGSMSGDKQEKPSNKEGEEEVVLLPLEEGVFTSNLGLPLIVVGTKVDSSSVLEKDRDYKLEHFDFIQMTIRKFCLQFGAACVYSGKEGKNKDALYRYILHRSYGLPCNVEGQDAEMDTLFIPAGWDTHTKIGVLKEALKNIDAEDPFEEVITPPIVHNSMADEREVFAEEEQDFLQKQKPLLGKSASKDSAEQVTGRRPSTGGRTSSVSAGGSSASITKRTSSVSHTGASASANGGAAGAGKADVLANFFNSLLNKKSPAAPAAAAATNGTARADAEKALSSMAKK